MDKNKNKNKPLSKKVGTGTSLILAGLIASSAVPSSTFAEEKDKMKTNIKLETSNSSPRASIGTGYINKIVNLSNKDGVLNFKSTSKSSIAMGVGTQTKTTIDVDPEIADEFFSTPGYEKYIGGSVDRLSGIGIGNDNIAMSELWNKPTGILAGSDTAKYDAKTHSIVIYSNKSIASVTTYQNVVLTLDLGRWSKDTGRVVERKNNYGFMLQSSPNDLAVNWSWSGAYSVLLEDVEDSWIENKVEPTTIKSDDDKVFYGNGKQDRVNEHETDYSVELSLNNKVIMHPMNDDGDWMIDLSDYSIPDGEVVSARVVGIEKEEHQNGKKSTKYSEKTRYTIGKDSVPWDKWTVKAPSLSDTYDEETLITGTLPQQNVQNGRTYTYVVEVDGNEIFRHDYDGDNDEFAAPIFDDYLKKGQKITSYVIGHEPDQQDKKSDVTETVVKENPDQESGWDKWVVNNATIDNAVENSDSIQTTVPIQSKFNSRSYELQVYVNDELIDMKKEISYLGSEFVSALPSGQQLKVGDKVKAIVIGHEPDEQDKQSEETIVTVKDESNWEAWELADPTLNEVTNQDRKVTGHISAQSVDYNRNYELQVKANGNIVATESVTSDTDYEIALPDDVKLYENDEVSVQIIGHQENREDKVGKEVKSKVKDGSNWSDWTVTSPGLNEVSDNAKELTGHILEQSTEYGRTYELEAFINGESIDKQKVNANEDYSFTLPEGTELKVGDKVAVQLIGHQEGKEDKVSEETVQEVKDGSNWSDWTVKEATINDIFENDQKVTGHMPEQNTEHDRNYQLAVSVNGTEVGKFDVLANEDYEITLPENIKLKEKDTVEVKVIGHQKGKDDKESKVVSTIVQKKELPTTSQFNIGYWENFGLVYEGQIFNEGWDMSDASRISKDVQLLNESGTVVKTLKAANTDWYEKGVYNGYQLIVDNDTLGDLPEGTYTLRMQVKIDGSVVGETDLELKRQLARMGSMHDNYADMEKVVLKENVVSPVVINNHPGINISKIEKDANVQQFNKYWNKEGQLVFDGYFNMEESLKETTKKLTIVDNENNVVYEKEGLREAPTSWGVPTNVSDDNTFQVIVPNEFSDQKQYKYTVSIISSDGKEILSAPLN
ncbi:hypothetical protein COD67_14215 [Bacillus cereus]|nr:hypothetical protein COI89_12490 [Bacillus cereus]PGU66178.1 hypothetical protein COD67_14215 [Bacillus cereus]